MTVTAAWSTITSVTALSLSLSSQPVAAGHRRRSPCPAACYTPDDYSLVLKGMSFEDIEAGRPLNSRQDPFNGNQDPTQAVASGIFQINTAVSTFQRLVNTLGTPKDAPQLREKLNKRWPDKGCKRRGQWCSILMEYGAAVG